MSYFKDAEHLYRCLGALFERVRADPEIGPRLAAAGIVIKFVYDDPAAEITIDMKAPPQEGTFFTTHYGKNELTADVEMSMKGDIAHKFWFGKVNLVAALSRRQIVARGPIPKILKLLPAISPAYQMYPGVLKDIGEDKLLTV